MTPEIAKRLASAGILLGTQAREYCLFTRGNCMALAQLAEGRFVSIGSSGMLTERGLSYLTWSEGKAWLSSHGNRVEAADSEVEAITRFSEDLQSALGLKKRN